METIAPKGQETRGGPGRIAFLVLSFYLSAVTAAGQATLLGEWHYYPWAWIDGVRVEDNAAGQEKWLLRANKIGTVETRVDVGVAARLRLRTEGPEVTIPGLDGAKTTKEINCAMEVTWETKGSQLVITRTDETIKYTFYWLDPYWLIICQRSGWTPVVGFLRRPFPTPTPR